MKLYHSQYTRSARARWMLEETGSPYDLEQIVLSKGQHKTPEYLAVHPHGVVPAFVDGDLKMMESSAIVMHLADKFPEKRLAPALGSNERATYYSWMVYVPATMDPVLETLTLHTKLLPEEKRSPAVVEAQKKRLHAIAKVVEEAIGGREFIVGKSFTAADLVMTSAIGWMGFIGVLADHPKLIAYSAVHCARPAYVRAHAD